GRRRNAYGIVMVRRGPAVQFTPMESPPTSDPPSDLAAALPIAAPVRRRPRSRLGVAGLVFLVGMFLGCVVTLPWTMGRVSPAGVDPEQGGTARYAWQEREARHLPPSWWPWNNTEEVQRRRELTAEARAREVAAAR